MKHLLYRRMLAELAAEAVSGDARFARQAQRDLLVAEFVKDTIKDFDKKADKEQADEISAAKKK